MQLCEEMDAEHTCLPVSIEMRWHSKGRSLARVFELLELLQKFLLENQSPLAAHFSNTEWVAKLAYSWHIQPAQWTQSVTSGENDEADTVASFKAKLELWWWWVTIGIFDMFQTLAKVLNETEPGPSFFQFVHDHLSQLSTELEHYYPTTKDSWTGKEWVYNPFVNKPGELSLSRLEENQLLEIENDDGLIVMFETTSNLHMFWIKVEVE